MNLPTSVGPSTGLDGVQASVLDWAEHHRRDLPWRATRDPWAILVSEVMLQQTQVTRIVERWPRFIDRFPSPAACAAASLAEVLREWQGLGYPRRARYLYLCARHVTNLGRFPDELDALLELPGVGPYTARAVLAFAFEADAAVVDTNVARILARVVGRSLSARESQHLADSLVPAAQSWAWNQAMIDIGAQHCRPTPNCNRCPFGDRCTWRGDTSLPDPAIGSAKVSKKQARFNGSDRQARGLLMAELSKRSVPRAEAPAVMNRPPPSARRLIDDLIDEGLCTEIDGVLALGDGPAVGGSAVGYAGSVRAVTMSSKAASA